MYVCAYVCVRERDKEKERRKIDFINNLLFPPNFGAHKMMVNTGTLIFAEVFMEKAEGQKIESRTPIFT